jgi:uncharacterized protein
MSKRIVVRMCSICREKDSKRQLTRLVRTPEGLVLDPTGKMNGRGAYLCDKPDCWHKAATTEVLSKALRVPLTEADRERIRQVVL